VLLQEGRAAVDRALARLTETLLGAAPFSVAEPIRYALLAGGKRLRPILCIEAYRAAGGAECEGLLDIACALELLHTYSLIHDDLPCMDDDDLRRGHPTTHRAFGELRAILAGATLIPLAFRAADRGCSGLGMPPQQRARVIRAFARGASGMVDGQVMDLEAERRHVPVVELEAIHGAKTGALLVASLEVGGLAAGASDGVVAALVEYGRGVGLAFQIADDVLDVTAAAEQIGKTSGRDRELGKATFPGLLGLAEARERAEVVLESAVLALEEGGVATPELRALARYAVERER
jgi:geranylgeranyl diphosphate synthase type II